MTQTVNNLISLFANSSSQVDKVVFGIADNKNCCHCSACEAAKTNYGAISGTTLKFINDVSSAVYARLGETGKSYIEFIIFAYYAYKAAPVKNGSATITANEHVRVLFAPIEVDYNSLFTDSVNEEAYNNLVQWKKVSKLYAWLYETNFNNYLFPLNTFEATARNYKILHDNGVTLMYSEGQHNMYKARTGFNALKKYIDAKFMIDVNSSYDDCVYKFFNYYYGSGGSYMRSFFNEMVAHLEHIESTSPYKEILYDGGKTSIYQNISNWALWDKEELTRWVGYCDSALALEPDISSIEYKHILTESIFPRFALITLFKSTYTISELRLLRESFETDCKTLGITITKEGSWGDYNLQTHYYDIWHNSEEVYVNKNTISGVKYVSDSDSNRIQFTLNTTNNIEANEAWGYTHSLGFDFYYAEIVSNSGTTTYKPVALVKNDANTYLLLFTKYLDYPSGSYISRNKENGGTGNYYSFANRDTITIKGLAFHVYNGKEIIIEFDLSFKKTYSGISLQ